MLRRRAVALPLICLLLGAPTAWSQERTQEPSPPTVAIEAHLGLAGFLDDYEERDHTVVGAAARFRLSPRLSFGPEFVRMTGPGQDRDTFLMGSLWVDLLKPDPAEPDAIEPFLVVGGGLMHHSDGNGIITYSSTEGAFTFGGGLRFTVGRRWYGVAEVRGGWEPHVRLVAGLGYRFGGRP
jgi:hypothetical protein